MIYKNYLNTKTEVFNLRMNKATKKKLEELSKEDFNNNCSELIRFLIDQEQERRGLKAPLTNLH